jgi:hypothetical protein
MFTIPSLLFICGVWVLFFAIHIDKKFNDCLLFIEEKLINWMDENCKKTFNVTYKRRWYSFCVITNMINVVYFAVTIFINSYWPEFAKIIELEWAYLWSSWVIAIGFLILNMTVLGFSIRIEKELKPMKANKLRAYIWITYGIAISVITYNIIITSMEMLLTDEAEIIFITSYDYLFLLLTIVSNLGFKAVLSVSININDSIEYKIIQVNYK